MTDVLLPMIAFVIAPGLAMAIMIVVLSLVRMRP